MMFTVGPIPTEDVEFLGVLEMGGKQVDEKKRLKSKKDRIPSHIRNISMIRI
jgi:hypothetical protein